MKLQRLTPLFAALLMTGFCTVSQAQAQAAAAPASAASAPREGLRPEVAKALNAAQEALRTGQHAEALRQVAAAEAIANRTPYEAFFIERFRGAAAASAGDDALAVKSFEAMLAMNRLQGEERLPFLEAIVRSYFRAKDYPAALVALDRYTQAGGKNAELARLRVNAYYLTGNHAAAIPGLEERVKSAEVGAKAADEPSLRMLADSYSKTRNDAGYFATLEKLVSAYPRRELWRDLVSRLQKRTGFGDRQWLDALRLLESVGALDDPDLYMGLAESALDCGLPIEAKRVLDAGFAAQKLGTGPEAAKHAQFREQVNKQAAEDTKALAANPSPRTADTLVSTGEGQVSAGRTARGIELIEQGIARGGLRRPDEARLRLAQAYLTAGNKAKAIEIFKSLSTVQTGGFAELAKYWTWVAEKS